MHADGRPTNRQLINREALQHFRQDAMLINAARGTLVDHNALASWLDEHPDAFAALDVHDPEPPSPTHRLYGCDNTIILPHLASRTQTALRNMSWVVRDVLNVLQGKKPEHPATGV